MFVSTVPLDVAFHVQSTLSVQIAHASVRELHTSIVSVPLVIVITGIVVSSTITVLVTVVATFPFVSV